MGRIIDFASDNRAPPAGAIIDALARASSGYAPAYGEDDWSRKAQQMLRQLFADNVHAYPVISGTAANALAISALAPPYGAVFCHRLSHLYSDECGAPEALSGAKLIPVDGADAKLEPRAVEAAVAELTVGSQHSVQPAALSITQPTERGTVYSLEELAALGECAARHGLAVHIDGARLANALCALETSPAELCARARADALSFGASKGGALAAEAVLLFGEQRAREFPFRRKRAGHLISKMRTVSAQLCAFLDGGLWLELARHANAMAATLAAGLARFADIALEHPVEANLVFVRLPGELGDRLRARGFRFFGIGPEEQRLVRLVTSHATSADEVNELIAAIAELTGQRSIVHADPLTDRV